MQLQDCAKPSVDILKVNVTIHPDSMEVRKF